MEIKVDVPDGKSGDWEVSTFEVDKQGAQLHNLREAFNNHHRNVDVGEYKKLTYKNEIVASNTPAEVHDVWEPIAQGKRKGGHILINGLGLGMILVPLLESKNTKITVIELSQDVINLVAPTYQDERVEIIKHDALTFKPNGMRFTVVWHDIWNSICEANLDDMHILHRKYGRRCDWQGSWARWECERQRRESKRREAEYKMFNTIGGYLAGEDV